MFGNLHKLLDRIENVLRDVILIIQVLDKSVTPTDLTKGGKQ